MIFNPNVMAAAGGGGGAVVGTYTGDGKVSRTIEFDFEPAAVFIQSLTATPYISLVLNGTGKARVIANSAVIYSATIEANKLILNPGSGYLGYCNTSNTQYQYVVIPKA